MEVALRTGRDRTIGHFLGRPATEGQGNSAAQVALRIVVAVVDWLAVGGAKGEPARHDCQLLYGIRSRNQQAHQRVAGLVVGD